MIWNLDKPENFHEIDEKLKTAVKNRIKVDLRQFKFQDFPAHVADSRNNAWKIIINTMMLSEFGAIWWLDASVQPKNGRIVEDLSLYHGDLKPKNRPSKYELTYHEVLANMTQLQIHRKKACFLFTAASTLKNNKESTFAGIHKFLNYTEDTFWNAESIKSEIMDSNRLVTVEKWLSKTNAVMHETTAMYQSILYDETGVCRRELFRPMFFCALVEECISPVKKGGCENKKKCKHRFDQSITNLVVNEFYGYDKTEFVMRGLMSVNGMIFHDYMDKKRKLWRHPDDLMTA